MGYGYALVFVPGRLGDALAALGGAGLMVLFSLGWWRLYMALERWLRKF